MRTIKFRAWDGKEMRFDFMVARPQISNCLSVMTDEQFAQFAYNVKEWKVMQFTGLTDKYGKEIYEGDTGKYFYRKGVVVYSDKHGAYCLFSFDDDTYVQLSKYFVCDVEITGNIHENQ